MSAQVEETSVLFIHPPQKYDLQHYSFLSAGMLLNAWFLSKNGLKVIISKVKKRDELLNIINKLKPSHVIISLHWSVHSYGAIQVAKDIKKHCEEILVGLAGNTATYYAREILARFGNYIDFICRGDCEIPLYLYIRKNIVTDNVILSPYYKYSKPKKIRYMYKTNKIILSSFSLEDLIKYHEYLKCVFTKDKIVFIISGKGCKFSCIHCGGSAYFYNRNYGYDFVSRDIVAIIRDTIYSHANFTEIRKFFTHDIFSLYSITEQKYFATNLPKELYVEYELFDIPQNIEIFREFITKLQSKSIIAISIDYIDDELRLKFNKGKKLSYGTLVKFLCKMSKEIKARDIFIYLYIIRNFPRRHTVLALDEFINKLYNDISKLGLRENTLILSMDISIDPGSELYEYPKKYGIKVLFSDFYELYKLYSKIDKKNYRIIGFR